MPASGFQLGLMISVGTYKETQPSSLMSDQERALVRVALAFEKAGVITIGSVGEKEDGDWQPEFIGQPFELRACREGTTPLPLRV